MRAASRPPRRRSPCSPAPAAAPRPGRAAVAGRPARAGPRLRGADARCCSTSRARPQRLVRARASASCAARSRAGLRRDAPARRPRGAGGAGRRGARRARAGRDRARGRPRAPARRAPARQLRGHGRGRRAPGTRDRAASWLLLREFRKATRFTRPGVDATLAVRELGARAPSPRKAALERHEGPARRLPGRASTDRLGEAEDAAERGFGARWAQTAALAAGLWPILAPEYETDRGAAAAERADAAFAALARSAAAARPAASRRRAPRSRRRSTGSPPRPSPREEQARRAGQLVRFLDLIPIEYDRGTDDGRVT